MSISSKKLLFVEDDTGMKTLGAATSTDTVISSSCAKREKKRKPRFTLTIPHRNKATLLRNLCVASVH